MVMQLYGAPTGNCQRAAIALEEAGIPYEPILVDLRRAEHRTPSFLQRRNPAGKVPVLVSEDTTLPLNLPQSNAIVFFASERQPGKLLPEGPSADRALAVERFFYFLTDVIANAHASYQLRWRGQQDASRILLGLAMDAAEFAEHFVQEQPFMAGANFTLADIAAYPAIASLADVIDWQRVPALQKWFTSVEVRPSIARGMRAFAW